MRRYAKVMLALTVLVLLVLMIHTGLDIQARDSAYLVFTEHADESLLQRLEESRIPYVIDEAGRLMIKAKDSEQVLGCCT
ncbi:hypothetical protein [Paenibacillus campinasensis]|uniref:Uncharacterized protein n=2 Tax=Paenibacillus campinasensis TaxID=66347 RepID=A0ABW9T5H6_9BACL|nr:hypothetical protein [Paenibacillus campinasensis]MUG68575.1 hypothetical protein [Paenibacillus campinasensis]